MTLSEKLDKILIQGGSWKTILGGLWVTIQISALALVLGTVLGALICLLRTRKNPIVRADSPVVNIYRDQ
jgi:polar amino acid transport system permease protein/polar amino acid transport system substrate-binding protein